jgi:hypothetical protein
MMAQNRIYARALSDFAPEVVEASCDEWARTKHFWPELASLLQLCDENERLMEAARRPKLAAPPPPIPDPPPSDEQRLAQWRATDASLSESATGAYAAILQNLARGMIDKRKREHPELAARYYAERGDAE